MDSLCCLLCRNNLRTEEQHMTSFDLVNHTDNEWPLLSDHSIHISSRQSGTLKSCLCFYVDEACFSVFNEKLLQGCGLWARC